MSIVPRPHAIVLSIDCNFYGPATLCLRSLARAFPNHPQVIVLCQDVTPAMRRRLELDFRAETRDAVLAPEEYGPLMQHLDQTLNASSFYARLRLWSEEFDSFEMLLFLDADMLIVRPLDGLFSGTEFFAVEDFLFSDEVIFPRPLTPAIEALLIEDKIEVPKTQANAGVFVLPRALRGKAQHRELLALLNRYATHSRYADQSIINLWMAKHHIAPVPEFDFNMQTNVVLRAPLASFDDVAILHLSAIPNPAMRLAMMRILSLGIGLRITRRQLKWLWHAMLTKPTLTHVLARMFGRPAGTNG